MFEKAVANYRNGQLRAPDVIVGKNQVDYFVYQLGTHHFFLKLMAKGMQTRQFKLKDLREYYGLKSRTAKGALPEFEAIKEKYMNELKNNK